MRKNLILSIAMLSCLSAGAAIVKEIPSYYKMDYSGRTAAIEFIDQVKMTTTQEIILSGNSGYAFSNSDGYACNLTTLNHQKTILPKGVVLLAKSEFKNAFIDWSNRGDDGKEIILQDAKKNGYLLQCGSISNGHSAWYSGEGGSDFDDDKNICVTHHGYTENVHTGPALYRDSTVSEKMRDLYDSKRYINGMDPVSYSKGYYFRCFHRQHTVQDLKDLFLSKGVELKLFQTM